MLRDMVFYISKVCIVYFLVSSPSMTLKRKISLKVKPGAIEANVAK